MAPLTWSLHLNEAPPECWNPLYKTTSCPRSVFEGQNALHLRGVNRENPLHSTKPTRHFSKPTRRFGGAKMPQIRSGGAMETRIQSLSITPWLPERWRGLILSVCTRHKHRIGNHQTRNPNAHFIEELMVCNLRETRCCLIDLVFLFYFFEILY